MDPIADVVRSVRLTGAVFLQARFSAPWCVRTRVTPDVFKPFLRTAAQVIAYHYVLEGSLQVWVPGGPAKTLRAGEIVIVPRNEEHMLASATGLPAVSADTLVQPAVEGGLLRIHHGGGGEAALVVCGFLGSDEFHNPLMAALPGVMKLDVRAATSRDWIESSVRFAANQLADGQLELSPVLPRLSELLLVEAIRQYSSEAPDEELGWLKALKDPQVARALVLMHKDISAPWSAEGLAREVALSRSAFMERFRTLVGMPPIRYLTLWRLKSAKLQLGETRKSVAQLAHAVGYESEEAFSRAFKREFGLSPGHWRERQAQA